VLISPLAQARGAGGAAPDSEASSYDALLTAARAGGSDGDAYRDTTTGQRFRRLTPSNGGGLPLLVPDWLYSRLTGACVEEGGSPNYFDSADTEAALTARGLLLAAGGTGTIGKVTDGALELRSGSTAWEGARVTFPRTTAQAHSLFLAKVKIVSSVSDARHPWYFAAGGQQIRVSVDTATAGVRLNFADGSWTILGGDLPGPDLGTGSYVWFFAWLTSTAGAHCRLWTANSRIGGGDAVSVNYTTLAVVSAQDAIQLWAYNPGGSAAQNIDIAEAYWLAAE
jgi:hypothetical protein